MNFWDVEVWGGMNVFAMLLLGLLMASLLKKAFRVLRESLMPTAVLGGFILLGISGIYMAFSGKSMFYTKFMGGNGFDILEMITYHALALGFIASTFESADNNASAKRKIEIFNTGVTTVSTYLVQAITGLGLTILISKFLTDIFPAAGMILPFGYGQGTGQAMNYGGIYETQYGFVGGKSFGLAIATMGFLSASIGGVLYLSWLKRKNNLKRQETGSVREEIEKAYGQDEIPLFENMDTLTVQIAFILVSYMITYGLIYVIGELVPGLKSIIYGFNFLIGVLVATGMKKLLATIMVVIMVIVSALSLTACMGEGLSVKDSYVDENLHLIVEYTDGTKEDLGYVGVEVEKEVLPPIYTVTFVDKKSVTVALV